MAASTSGAGRLLGLVLVIRWAPTSAANIASNLASPGISTALQLLSLILVLHHLWSSQAVASEPCTAVQLMLVKPVLQTS